ncbi:g10451 [Coccomyxa elongata]
MVYDWDNAWWASNLLLWKQTRNLRYKAQLDSFFNRWTHGGNGVVLTTKGLALAGSIGQLSNAANAALLGLLYGRYSGGGDGIARACWARRQVQYILGSSGRPSYMVGWGNNPPAHIPNPAASCPTSVQPCAGFLASSPQYSSPDANPHVLVGAVVSGPDAR